VATAHIPFRTMADWLLQEFKHQPEAARPMRSALDSIITDV